ncbi:MAG: metallophosphoesterase family protein [Solirubrobacteraceae bacterium]|nr:metallophosphoesterase family protein [Solirubrobacteraceae bacterium]
MRTAILSDIHGNRHAFEAVLADAHSQHVDEAWCLGDLVGYGADPNACVRLAREHCAIVLAGNHDLVVTATMPMDDFSRNAAVAAQWTQDEMDLDNLEFLRRLAPDGIEHEIGLFHASPRDPVWEYVLSSLLAEACFAVQEQRVALIGHTHVALSFSQAPGEAAEGSTRKAGDVADISAGKWLLNPGSVGQPRDGDARAAWMLLDTDAWTAEWRRVEYDVDGAGQAILAAGLPSSLAERLQYGQ